jgi:hypothetical protein
VGVQLAFWRRGDDGAHLVYRQLIERHGPSAADPSFRLEGAGPVLRDRPSQLLEPMPTARDTRAPRGGLPTHPE